MVLIVLVRFFRSVSFVRANSKVTGSTTGITTKRTPGMEGTGEKLSQHFRADSLRKMWYLPKGKAGSVKLSVSLDPLNETLPCSLCSDSKRVMTATGRSKSTPNTQPNVP